MSVGSCPTVITWDNFRNRPWEDLSICLMPIVDTDIIGKNLNELNLLRDKLTNISQIFGLYLNTIPTGGDLNSKLVEIGRLQGIIESKKKQLRDSEQDLGTAQTRQEITAKPITKTSYYESISGRLGFTKPIHTLSVSIMIGAGLFFVLCSALLLKEFVFKSTMQNISYNSTQVNSATGFFFSDPRFYAVMSGFVFVGIVISGLAYFGYLGKK
jgi:hypothetical protein